MRMFSSAEEPLEDRPPGPGLILQVGHSRYRVAGLPGSEVAPCPPLARVPDGPDWMLGISLHKNEAIPVIHLQHVLQGPSRVPTRNARMLVVRAGARPIAYLVDDIDADSATGAEHRDTVGGTESAPTELDLLTVGRVLMTRACAVVSR
jgi:hypothetical protein